MTNSCTIRKATLTDAEAIGFVHVRSWQETYQGILPAAYLDALSVTERQSIWKTRLAGQHSLYVAEKGGQVVGIASGGKPLHPHSAMRSELYLIYLLKAYHRQGIGTLLFHAVTRELEHPFGVWAIADNPACHFYAAMGGSITAEKWDEIGSQKVREILYMYGYN